MFTSCAPCLDQGVAGTGPGGRIVAADVEKLIASGGAKPVRTTGGPGPFSCSTTFCTNTKRVFLLPLLLTPLLTALHPSRASCFADGCRLRLWRCPLGRFRRAPGAPCLRGHPCVDHQESHGLEAAGVQDDHPALLPVRGLQDRLDDEAQGTAEQVPREGGNQGLRQRLCHQGKQHKPLFLLFSLQKSSLEVLVRNNRPLLRV